MKNKTWYYYGNGIDSFGKDDLWQESETPKLKDDEILTRVDAVAICASDVKMISMGNDYPLFRNRDFDLNPAILGHELSLTIVEVGKNLTDKWKVGTRIGVQPDVYMKGVRYCIGVTVAGGMQKYLVLHESVFHSDYGVTIFPVKEQLSYAEVAMLEPNACIEAAYRPFSRTSFSNDKSLLIYCEVRIEEFNLDIDLKHKKKYYIKNLDELKSIDDKFEDVLILGNPKEAVIEYIINHLAINSVFCWLTDEEGEMEVSCDIAKIHYDKIFFAGTKTKRLSDAFKYKENRFELNKKGNLLVVGGAGAMGRMHVLRAIMDPNGPKTIVVTARGRARIDNLINSFSKSAFKRGKELICLATSENDWKEQLKKIAPEGFDDLVVCAPGIEPVDEGIPFVKKDGKIILFSGTKYGTYAKLPIGNIPSYGLKLNASSGSSVEDELQVLHKIEEGTLNPNQNIAAIVGFDSVKEALIAVSNGMYSGKVIIYPQLDKLPLVPVTELERISIKLKQYVETNDWDHQAEKIMFSYFKTGEED